MAWQESSIVQQRTEFVMLASNQNANISELCRRFGISRGTGYKWLARFKVDGKPSLQDQSRRPRISPERTSDAAENAVLALRDQHPAWGGRKLRTRLKTLGQKDVPAASTITAILRRHGRLDAAESSRHKAFTRFEHERPNQLWQMDFKGHVPMQTGSRCHPLTIIDDHSRFSICLRACDNEQGDVVQTHLIAAFRRYGLPERVLCDNGPPWGVAPALGRHTKLTTWMLRLGIHTSHGRPYHPQTQGKDERFHRTLKAELLSRLELRDTDHAQQAFDAWRDVYNLQRPSEAIGLATPSTRYQPSPRPYPETLPPLEFSPEDDVRRVKGNGAVSYKDRFWYVGVAFAGEHVGVRETPGTVEVRYGPHVVATIDRIDSYTKRRPAYRPVARGGATPIEPAPDASDPQPPTTAETLINAQPLMCQ